MPGHIAGRMILPGTKTPGKNFLRFRATGTVATGNVVSCSGNIYFFKGFIHGCFSQD